MKRFLLLTLFLSSSISISSFCQKGQLENRSTLITWPSEYQPEKSNFFVHNEISIEASPEEVWNILIDALAWESWYEGAKNVSFVDPTESALQANSRFNWETMGLKFPNTTIQEYEPYRLLAWESKIKSIQGYHVWLIVPTDTGCKVITEEAQQGWLTFLEKTFQGKKLHQLHDIWLSGLKEKAEWNKD